LPNAYVCRIARRQFLSQFGKMLRLATYCLIAVTYTFSLVYDVLYVPTLPKNGCWFLKLRFLTYLNFICHFVYFWLCVFRAFTDRLAERTDVGPHRAHPAPPTYYPKSKLHSVCDFTYAVIALPIGVFVVLMFWILYSIDREMVYPDYLDDIIPSWYNNVLHVAPLPFILVDSLLVCHRYPTKLRGLTILTLLALVYELSLIANYFIAGYWLYGVFDVLSLQEKIIFLILLIAMLNILYLAGDFFNQIVWGTASHPPGNEKSNVLSETRRAKLRRD
ncbi:Androgen-induced -like protein, partial [Trichinella zimbabwensis]